MSAVTLSYAETLDWLAEHEGRDVSVTVPFAHIAGRLSAATVAEDYEELEPAEDGELIRPVARFYVGEASYFDVGFVSFKGATRGGGLDALTISVGDAALQIWERHG